MLGGIGGRRRRGRQRKGRQSITDSDVSLSELRELVMDREAWHSLRECSPPGSSVHGILQARMLEWVARSPTLRVDSLPAEPQGKIIKWKG